ncbi:MAG: hypothetical protein EOM76_02360 [Sphingobacteriia bacterium]|jgi:2',3'-cyclic-nucleotide 2'-phosphodiesterase (5'-nucleotidase family)|nr:5'-nucleotidase C-terminal domain-containing protein [Paludibacteraceae bacterium]NCA79019.1 hypothetical protein [Sphingobacteriia bacterium]
MKAHTLIVIFALVSLFACGRTNPKIVSSDFIPVSAVTPVDTAFHKQLDAFKQQMSHEMDVEIGVSSQNMTAELPEGLLNNFVAETMLEYGNTIKHTDIAISNMGGLRRDLPEGNITVGIIYELMPFYNKLVFLELKGSEVDSLCQTIAKKGGDVVAGVSLMITQNHQATNIKVEGKPINPDKTYRIITTDYLSEGMDHLAPLANYQKIEHLNIVMSQMMIDAIKTKTAKKQLIKTTLKNNIYVEK